MWGYLAAAALPYVIGSFQDKPKAPTYRAPSLPDRSQYYNQLLDMAYNPNNRMYTLASDQVANNVNRALARQGLAGSSPGGQLAALSQANLANSFIDNQLRRAQDAFQTVSNYDLGRGNIEAGIAAQIYNNQRDQYNSQLASQAAVRQGIGNLAMLGANMYAESEAQKWWEERLATAGVINSANAAINGPTPTVGVPGMPAYQSSLPSYSSAGVGGSPYYSYGQTPGYGGIAVGANPLPFSYNSPYFGGL